MEERIDAEVTELGESTVFDGERGRLSAVGGDRIGDAFEAAAVLGAAGPTSSWRRRRAAGGRSSCAAVGKTRDMVPSRCS